MTAEKSALPSTAFLADWLRDARKRTLELVTDLSEGELLGRLHAVLDPPLWQVGYIAWFQEKWLLRRAGQSSVRADADALYDLAAVPHARRWDLTLPSRQESFDYLQQVLERILKWLEKGPTAEEIQLVPQAVFHEDIQGEALCHTRQALGYASPQPSSSTDAPSGSGGWPGDAEVPGGQFELGAAPDDPFALDKEKSSHPIELKPFHIAKAPVTQSEFAAFVERGGYHRPELWSAEGWHWRQATDARHPVYWRRASNGSWLRRQFDQWMVLEPHRPVQYVCWYEADAYCRWVSRRLPSEGEWEAAATGEVGPKGGLASRKRRFPWGDSPGTSEHANGDGRSLGCVDVACCPAGDSAFGCRQMIGNVWEWTADDYHAYPGFTPSRDWDGCPSPDSRLKVLRGGGWATRTRLLRTTIRQPCAPSRTDLSAGFRTCAP